jgi:hypothetical protein
MLDVKLSVKPAQMGLLLAAVGAGIGVNDTSVVLVAVQPLAVTVTV